MAKSLSLTLVLSIEDLSEASRSPNVDAAPLAGTQMIQLKASADVAGSHTDAPWSTTYQDARFSCAENTGNVLTWNAGGETVEDCMQACHSWGEEYVNKNSDRTCSAGFLYQKPDGTKSCRLYEKCDTCKPQAHAGTTFQLGDPCKAQCIRKDCKKDEGFKAKPGFRDILCASSQCTTDECCDMLPGWSTTTTTGVPVEFKGAACRSAWSLGWGRRCSEMYSTGITGHNWKAMQILTDLGGTKLLTKLHFDLSARYTVEFSNDCKEGGPRPPPPPGSAGDGIANAHPSSISDSWWTCTWFGLVDSEYDAGGDLSKAGGDLVFPKPVKARWAKVEALDTTRSSYIHMFFEGSDL